MLRPLSEADDASACGELAEERNKWSSELRARVAREYAQERALRLQHHRLWAPCHHNPAKSGSRGVDFSDQALDEPASTDPAPALLAQSPTTLWSYSISNNHQRGSTLRTSNRPLSAWPLGATHSSFRKNTSFTFPQELENRKHGTWRSKDEIEESIHRRWQSVEKLDEFSVLFSTGK